MATKIWRTSLEPDGLITALLLAVRRDEVGDLSRIKQDVARLSKDAEVKQEVAYMDRKVSSADALERLSLPRGW